MLSESRANTPEGLTESYEAAKALAPIVDEIKRGTPGSVQRMIEMAIPLRPVQWWNPMYVEQLKILCETIYLCSAYHREEMKAVHAKDFKQAKLFNQLANSQVPVMRALMTTLQLTPSSLHGQAARFHGATKAAQKVSDILTDVTDLYAS